MEYSELVMKEIFRFFTPAPLVIHKEVLKDIKIGEFQLKKGELCNILVIGNMRSPKYIKDPEEFNPERWREPIMAESNCSFIPFSSGYRNCIG